MPPEFKGLAKHETEHPPAMSGFKTLAILNDGTIGTSLFCMELKGWSYVNLFSVTI